MSILNTVTNFILDASIVYSFDRRGFLRHQKGFTPADLNVNCQDQHILVTGGNAGLGYACAKELATKGAQVTILCRNSQKAERAVNELKAHTENPNIHFLIADMSDLEKIKLALKNNALSKVDVLIHNAGVLLNSLEYTRQGFETTFATSILGPQLLTHLISKRQKDPPRIIWVSSGGMYPVKLDIKRLHTQKKTFDGVQTYAYCKRAQVVLSSLWWKKRGFWSQCMHPGWANTAGVEHALPHFWKFMHKHLRTPAQGADTMIWLAIAEQAHKNAGGYFWFDRQKVRTNYFPWTYSSTAKQNILWDYVEAKIKDYL